MQIVNWSPTSQLCPNIIMLIKFDSEAGSFTMIGETAIQLIKAMGHSGTVPGAILPADLPAALSRLKAAVEASPNGDPDAPDDDEKDHSEAMVSLRQRAFPLIDLVTRAIDRGTQVMWTK
ncbi:MAG: DUF1840 domain-containing protein [Betaproteobacteria bacterium]|jgi:hypothetical protein